MATLEVHDAEGRVQLVELARDHPVLFGTSSSCDLILEGPGIKPVHGRIRWKARRFKVEASPDAEFVLINGHRMASGSIHQGDEIVVGPCRMFLLRVAEGPEPVGRPVAGPPADEGRTRVLPPPVVAGSSPSPSLPRAKVSQTRPRSRSQPQSAESSPARAPTGALIEEAGWLDHLRTDSAGAKAKAKEKAKARRDAEGSKRPWSVPMPDWMRRLARRWQPHRDESPGRERIASSPLVIGLVASLAILIVLGWWLRSIITATVATRTLNRAVANYEDGDYRTAIRDFDAFLAGHSEDTRAGRALVLRGMADVRQNVSPNGSTWSSALEAAREMVEQSGQTEEFRDVQVDLAELVIRIGEGLADRARHTADPKRLAEAESAVRLHGRIAGEPALAFLNRSRLPARLAEARAAVRKAQVRSQTLAAMDRAIEEGSAARVYLARDALIGQYADLAPDRELIRRMTEANDLIRKAVTVDTTRRSAARKDRPEPMGPATSLVHRSRPEDPPARMALESIVFAIADGLAYALDADAGAPLWQAPLGLASPYVPQPIPGDETVLAFDARTDELVRRDARSGRLIWRLEVGERVVDPPLVLGNQLAQVVPSGKVLMIALESGELQATINLGRPLARMPVHDESGRHLYVVSRQDCLFILTRDPLACSAVEYLGHPDGSVPCAPARLGRFLVIPQNDTLADGRWQVLVLDEDGGRARPVQEVPVAGWTWQTPTAAGPIVWATGDRSGFEAFAVGDYASKSPFRSVARLTADATSSGPAFAWARSERELWAASGHPGKFVLDLEHGAIEPKAPLPVPGPALAPIQAAGGRLVATFQDRETGGVAVWGIDPEAGPAAGAGSGAVVWKTIVGAPWPTVPVVVQAPSGVATALATIGRDGREVRITVEQLARGGFAVSRIPAPGEFLLPPGRCLRLGRAGQAAVTVIVPPAGSNSDSLWVEDPTRPAGWRETALPAAPATDPLVWGDTLLVPGTDGRVYLIDPVTGHSRAEPYVPQFDRDRQGAWRAPAALDQHTVVLADDMGRVRRIGLKTTPVPRLTAEAETTLDRPIVADPASTGGAVLVATADRRVRSLAARDLSPVGAWPLDAPLARPPLGLGDGGLVLDRAGGVTAFGRDGQRRWTIRLGAEVVGTPQVLDHSLGFLTADGVLHVRARADGAAIARHALGILPTAGPFPVGREMMIAVAPGTLRPLLPALESVGRGGKATSPSSRTQGVSERSERTNP